jgi:hypothetical protein
VNRGFLIFWGKRIQSKHALFPGCAGFFLIRQNGFPGIAPAAILPDIILMEGVTR